MREHGEFPISFIVFHSRFQVLIKFVECITKQGQLTQQFHEHRQHGTLDF